MERNIGEISEFQNERYKVVKDFEGTCESCAFKDDYCSSYKEIGYCSGDVRNDGISVIFVKADKPINSNKKKLLLII